MKRRTYDEGNEICADQDAYTIYAKINSGICINIATTGPCQSTIAGGCSGTMLHFNSNKFLLKLK